MIVFLKDSANCNGGKWIIRFKKVVSGRFWEDLVMQIFSSVTFFIFLDKMYGYGMIMENVNTLIY